MQPCHNLSNSLDTQPSFHISSSVATQPIQCERWLLPNMEFLFAGRAAFSNLRQLVDLLSQSAHDSVDIAVVLLPQDYTVKEIKLTRMTMVFQCVGYDPDRIISVPIPNGHLFSAAVDIIPQKERTNFVTQFTDQYFSPVEQMRLAFEPDKLPLKFLD